MRAWTALLCLLVACATSPGPPAPGMASAWGHLRLVPRDGVTPGSAEPGAYGDRRLRDVSFVDYDAPGFAVVYVEEAVPPAGTLELAIRHGRLGTRLEPTRGALGARGHLVVRNETALAHVISYPAAGAIRRLEPGERAEIDVARTGEQGIFLLDVPAAEATVFAAPGAYDVVSASGRYALTDLAPGPRVIRAWHPRFPPAMTPVDLAADTLVEVDLRMGVGQMEPRGADAHAH